MHKRSSAFTLIELLAVIAIMVVMTGLIAPAFTGLKSAQDVTKTAYDVAGILEQARAYAMANNTYVFVGIAEVDSSVASSVKPQVTTSASPYGRVAIAVVASRDGTRGYDINNPGDGTTGSWVTNYSKYNAVTTPGANLVAISKLQYFENAHMTPLFSTLPNSGGLARQTVTSGSYEIGSAACKSVTPFDWPLGSALNAGQYSFKKVINFDPQGVARIQYQTNTDTIVQYMEIGLQPAHGNAVSSGADVAAIQVNAITASIRIYRP